MKSRYFIFLVIIVLSASTPAFAQTLVIFKNAKSVEVDSVRYENDECIYTRNGSERRVPLDLIEEIYVLNTGTTYPPQQREPNEKVESKTPSKSDPDVNPSPQQEEPTLLQKLLAIFQKKPKNRQIPRTNVPQANRQIPRTNVPQANRASPKVELYTTSWCHYCQKAREFFRSRGIPFKEYDIERDKNAAARKKRLDKRNGVPFAVINGRGIHGWSAAAYEQALEGHP